MAARGLHPALAGLEALDESVAPNSDLDIAGLHFVAVGFVLRYVAGRCTVDKKTARHEACGMDCSHL